MTGTTLSAHWSYNKGGLRNDNVDGRGNIIKKSFLVYWKQLKSSNSCCTNLNPLGIKRFDSRISIYYSKWTPHCGANTMQKESLNPGRFELDTTLRQSIKSVYYGGMVVALCEDDKKNEQQYVVKSNPPCNFEPDHFKSLIGRKWSRNILNWKKARAKPAKFLVFIVKYVNL